MGSVYFVQAATLGLIKIGYASDLPARLSALRAQSPDRLSFLGSIEAERAKSVEVDLHLHFADCWSHGEWFKPAPRLISYIAAHATPPADAHWTETLVCAIYGRERLEAASVAA